MWNHIRDKIVKVRKEHECILCGDTINKGEHVISSTGSDDGIYTFYIHKKCEELTYGWGVVDWESNDPYDFKREYLKKA